MLVVIVSLLFPLKLWSPFSSEFTLIGSFPTIVVHGWWEPSMYSSLEVSVRTLGWCPRGLKYVGCVLEGPVVREVLPLSPFVVLCSASVYCRCQSVGCRVGATDTRGGKNFIPILKGFTIKWEQKRSKRLDCSVINIAGRYYYDHCHS